jgi:hypothetical protein
MRKAIFITALCIFLNVFAMTLWSQGRRIEYRPGSPRVGQMVTFESVDFVTQSVDWDFGDGTVINGGNRTVGHRFQSPGTYTVSAKDTPIDHTPVTTRITILGENRSVTVSPAEAAIDQPVTMAAHNFWSVSIRWDFGDGSQLLGAHTVVHRYKRTGVYTVTAREDCDDCPETFTAQVTVTGIDDRVRLEIAEILLDNGRQYKVAPRNSENLQAVLRMKMNGTGTVAGHWSVDGQPFDFFTRKVIEGELSEIYTRRSPGLPTMDPGIHTVTLELTKPADVQVTFPTLKYFVLPGETAVELSSPPDHFVAKEDEIPVFSWKQTKKAAAYQIAFANTFFPFVSDNYPLAWMDAGTELSYTPGRGVWNGIKRNRWTYWQVRAVDTGGNVTAASDIREIKVVIAGAEINIKKITDLEGNEIALADKGSIRSKPGSLLVHGSFRYTGNSQYMVLRVYVDDRFTDQLLFRNIKKDLEYDFETFVPHRGETSRVVFNVLKTSSPAVIVGIKELVLKK